MEILDLIANILFFLLVIISVAFAVIIVALCVALVSFALGAL